MPRDAALPLVANPDTRARSRGPPSLLSRLPKTKSEDDTAFTSRRVSLHVAAITPHRARYASSAAKMEDESCIAELAKVGGEVGHAVRLATIVWGPAVRKAVPRLSHPSPVTPVPRVSQPLRVTRWGSPVGLKTSRTSRRPSCSSSGLSTNALVSGSSLTSSPWAAMARASVRDRPHALLGCAGIHHGRFARDGECLEACKRQVECGREGGHGSGCSRFVIAQRGCCLVWLSQIWARPPIFAPPAPLH